MTAGRAIACAVGLAFLVLGVSVAIAADWPQWGGNEMKNMASAEKGLPESFVPGEKDPQGGGIRMETTQNVRWAARLGQMTCSTPTVAGGKVFIGTKRDDLGAVLCLDEATGKPLWEWTAPARQVPATIDGRKFEFSHFPRDLGVCSTVAVDGDRLYFVSQRLELVCLSVKGKPKSSAAAGKPAVLKAPAAPKPADAKPDKAPAQKPAEKAPPEKWPEGPGQAEQLWMFDVYEYGVRPSDAVDCSPVFDDKFVYICSGNGCDRQAEANKHDEDRKAPAPDAPNLMVFDKKTGKLVAKDDVRIAPRMFHGEWSSLALGKVGGKTLIFFGGGDGKCYAFEAPTAAADTPAILKMAWSVDCNPPEYQQFGDKDMILHYCLGDCRRSDALNKKNSDGTFAGMSEIIATPVFHKNRVYVAIGRDPAHGRGRGALWCIDATKTGDITQSGKIWCYQGLDRSISTVSIADGLLYVADVAGRLHCVDAETGKPYWIHETGAEVWGSTLVADGKVYFPTKKGLYVTAAGKDQKPITKITLGADVWPTPVAANGVLYVASKTYLWAVQAKPVAAAVPPAAVQPTSQPRALASGAL